MIINLSTSIIRMTKPRQIRWAGNVARVGAKMNACRILVGKPEGKRLLERRRHRQVDIIKMNLREIGWVSMDWIDLAQDRGQWRGHVNTSPWCLREASCCMDMLLSVKARDH
jgi:hypothetical protein